MSAPETANNAACSGSFVPMLTLGIPGSGTTAVMLGALLGFGVQPPDATWGNILSDGKNFLFDAPWLTFIPGITILLVVLAFNLCGEGLREAFNPKLKT